MTSKRQRPKRKNIPQWVKKAVLKRDRNCCGECKLIFITGEKMQFDHRPSIEQRPVNAEGTDYIPPQLDPDYIEALHEPCHDKRTFGRTPGAEKTVTIKGSDAWLAKKFRRLEGRTKRRPRRTIIPKGFAKIPSRPFPKRTKP